MGAPRIYHICGRRDWSEAMARGRYEGSGRDRRDGFIHFSTAEQIEPTAARYLAGQEELVLLAVDTAGLGQALRWEPSRDGARFPHLYGALPVSAVRDTWDLPLGPDGRHVFPAIDPA